MERESGRKLKAVRADNGGEYRGQFEEYSSSKGIRLEFTMLKTPELNGLAEEPTCHDQDTEPVAEEAEGAEIGTDQDPESDSDEEEIVKPAAKGQRACANDR